MIAYNYQTKGSRKPILPSNGSNWILATLPQRSMIHRARHSTHFDMFLKLQSSLPAIPLPSLRLFLTAAQSMIAYNYQTKGSRKPILPSNGSNWILATLPQRSMMHRARHSTHFDMFLKLQSSLPAIPLRSLRLFLTAAQSMIAYNYQTKGSRKPILHSNGSNWILATLPQRSMIHRARHSTHFDMFLKLQSSLPAIPLRSLRLFLTAAQSHINFWKALCTYSQCLPQHLCCRFRQLGLGPKIKPTRHHHHGRQHLDPMSLREMPGRLTPATHV